MNYYLECWKKYADFNGRARRQEYWMFVLFNFIFSLVLMLIPMVGIILYAIYMVAVFLPNLAVTVRRLHDIGKSGAWYCVIFIPLAGMIWLIVLLATEGERAENMYGADPKALEGGYRTVDNRQNGGPGETPFIKDDVYRASGNRLPEDDKTVYRRPETSQSSNFQNNKGMSFQTGYYSCTKCGAQVPKGIEVCPKCGNYMPES